MRKYDIHVHAAPKRTETAGGNPADPLSHYVASPDEIKEALSAKGIVKALLMSGGEHPFDDVNSLFCFNENCRAMHEADPAFFGWMCNFDPVSPETVEARMSVCKKYGAVGVGEVMVNQWMDSPFLTALFSAAERLDMPVTFHMSPEPGFSYGVCDRPGLPLLEKTLQRFPNLKLLGHSQVFWLEISADCPKEGNRERNGFGCEPVVRTGTVEWLFKTYPNLYGDLSAFSAYSAITRDRAFGLEFLETYQDRLFYATDATNRRTILPLGDYLDECVKCGELSRAAYEKIVYKNAKKIFG